MKTKVEEKPWIVGIDEAGEKWVGEKVRGTFARLFEVFAKKSKEWTASVRRHFQDSSCAAFQ